jgi:NADH dehydrogenase [ubiquinone] 1 alpha subcomplex assembly factor 1
MSYLLLLILGMLNHFVIFDFNTNTKTNDWKIIDDGVMGGISKSVITIDEDGNGIFEGHVSLENNGGFSSVRHQFKTVDVSKSKRFILRIQGDGKSYQFRVKSQLNIYYSYKFDFKTNKDWQIIEIPFDELIPTFRGRTLDMSSFPNKAIEEVGFLVSNKKEEDFKLKIDFVKVE